jgi:hypothetical protein
MSKGPVALSIAPEPTEGDERYYDAIYATVMESARGRWFLAEYARRNRNADTEFVLSAIDRMASLIQAGRDQQAHPAIPDESSDLPETISGSVPAQPQPGPPALLPAYVTSSTPSDLPALAERLQASAPVRPAAKSMPRAAPYDPLAALKALTDEERIALFT